MSNFNSRAACTSSHTDDWLQQRLVQAGMTSCGVVNLSGNSSAAQKEEVMEKFRTGYDFKYAGSPAFLITADIYKIF